MDLKRIPSNFVFSPRRKVTISSSSSYTNYFKAPFKDALSFIGFCHSPFILSSSGEKLPFSTKQCRHDGRSERRRYMREPLLTTIVIVTYCYFFPTLLEKWTEWRIKVILNHCWSSIFQLSVCSVLCCKIKLGMRRSTNTRVHWGCIQRITHLQHCSNSFSSFVLMKNSLWKASHSGYKNLRVYIAIHPLATWMNVMSRTAWCFQRSEAMLNIKILVNNRIFNNFNWNFQTIEVYIF